MAVTLNRSIEMLGRATGFFVSSTATGGSTTTVVDTSIVRYDANILKNKWLYIVTATQSTIVGTSRRISSLSGTTITVDSAYAATTTSGDTYYILSVDPDVMIDSLQQAARTLYPHLYLPTQDETLVVDNLVTNWDFETWDDSSTPNSWVDIGTPTVAQEANRKVHGTYSAIVTAGGVGQGIEQNILFANGVNIGEVENKTLHVRAWVWADDADSARIRVTYDGSTFDDGDYHSGSAEWEGHGLMYIDSAIDFTAASTEEMTISCEVANGKRAYFDSVVAWIDNVHNYTMPSTVIRGPHKVSMQADSADPNGYYAPLTVPQSGRILRLEHMGTLTAPTSSSSVELDESRTELLLAQAAVHMYHTLSNRDSGNAASHMQNAAIWQDRTDRLMSQPGMRMRQMSAHAREGWNVLESGETRKLVLGGRW